MAGKEAIAASCVLAAVAVIAILVATDTQLRRVLLFISGMGGVLAGRSATEGEPNGTPHRHRGIQLARHLAKEGAEDKKLETREGEMFDASDPFSEPVIK